MGRSTTGRVQLHDHKCSHQAAPHPCVRRATTSASRRRLADADGQARAALLRCRCRAVRFSATLCDIDEQLGHPQCNVGELAGCVGLDVPAVVEGADGRVRVIGASGVASGMSAPQRTGRPADAAASTTDAQIAAMWTDPGADGGELSPLQIDHDAVTAERFFKTGVTREPKTAPVEGERRDGPASPSRSTLWRAPRTSRAAP